MNKRIICLVIPSLNGGGMERVISELAEYYAFRDGIETHLILLGKGEKFYTIPEQVIVHEPDFIFNNRFRVYHMIKTIHFLRSKAKAIGPDAILSFGETYNSFVLLSTLFLKLKVFVSDRSKPDKRWGRFHETLRRILYPKAYGIIAQTKYAKTFLINEIHHKNIMVIPNPVKPFSDDISEKQNIILNVGRLISTKRLDVLIDVFSKTNFTNWQLWIVGDGPQREKLEQRVIDLGLLKNVIFWGSQKDIAFFYAKSKIFAFTSVSEGFPNALLEAMSAGLACISFDCVAGPSDIIQDSANGFLIPEMEIETYTAKLQKLIDNPELQKQLGQKAKETAAKFNINVIAEDYLKFLLS